MQLHNVNKVFTFKVKHPCPDLDLNVRSLASDASLRNIDQPSRNDVMVNTLGRKQEIRGSNSGHSKNFLKLCVL